MEVPLDVVRKHGLVSFEYKRTDGTIPLLAYVTPSGNIVTAVGISEPCHSTSFRIEGDHLVCNLCGTRWKLDTLRGASGGCADHPMKVLVHVVDNGRLMLKEATIQRPGAAL